VRAWFARSNPLPAFGVSREFRAIARTIESRWQPDAAGREKMRDRRSSGSSVFTAHRQARGCRRP
jgi:hypothetical protein